MTSIRRLPLLLAALAACLAFLPAAAQASHSQVALFEADDELHANPDGAMAQLRSLGVGAVRVNVEWSAIAPNPLSRVRPPGDASNDRSSFYPNGTWNYLDNVVHAALRYHIQLDFLVTGGAPYWADAPDAPFNNQFFNRHYGWHPSTAEYGAFVHAVGHRYGGRVHLWEIYNEPNFGEDLGPQAIDGSRYSVAPGYYRALVDVAWSALQSTVHGSKTIVIGNLAARGLGPSGPDPSHPEGLPGNFGQTKPLQFIRTLYCVDGRYRPLTGATAANTGCPTTAAARRSFRSAHPGLFNSAGFGIHPYPQGLPPTQESSHDRDYVAFNELPRLEQTLDKVVRVYGSRKHFPIYNNEYGYVTSPPAARSFHFASPTTAAVYINWAEYLSWRDPRLATYMQFLLADPPLGGPSQFFSGIEYPDGSHKPGYDAYRMPLFLPSTTARRGRTLEVWGCVRPAHSFGGRQRAQIQFASSAHGRFLAISTVTVRDSHGYFDVRVRFPRSGYVRLSWNEPGIGVVSSRTQAIRVR